jgi:signal transduction histidine kinase
VSLRLRLTVWVVVIYTMIQWATGGVFSVHQSVSIRAMFDQRLVEEAEALVGSISLVVPGIDRRSLDAMAAEEVRRRRMDRITIDVLREDGSSAVIGDPSPIDTNEIPYAAVFGGLDMAFVDLVGGPVENGGGGGGGRGGGYGDRAVAMSMLGADLRSYVLVVATDDATAQGQLALVRRIFLVSAILGPMAAALSGWIIAGIAVAPFERLRRVAARFGPNSLNQTFEIPMASKEVAALTEQLEESRVRIREAFAVQDRFLTNVSHELKTPIAVLLIEADTLRLENASEEVTSFVASAREEMSKLGRLMESFLMLARLSEGRPRVRAKRCRVNDLVMDAVDDCSAMAAQSGVRLSAELLLDEDEHEAEVSGDNQMLRTMLNNLLGTASRFTPRGKRVAVRVSLVSGRVRVAVSDEGAAIPHEEIEAIFDRSSEAGSHSKGGRGYGLGLAVAQGIAELHGGRIRAVNLDGGGCEFAVELPLAGPEDEVGDGAGPPE